MVTISNYTEKTAPINFSKQPEHIQEAHRDFTDYAEFYNEDKHIKEMLDNHMKLVNDIIKKKSGKKTAKTVKKVAQSAKKTADKAKKPVKKNTPKKAENPCKQSKPEPIKTEHYTEDVRLLRRFYRCIGKESQRRTILTIYRDFERRITERKVNRTSKHAELVGQCSRKLAALLNQMKHQNLTHATVNLDEAFESKVKKAANETAIRTSVNLLKRFVGIEGETKPEKAKVERIVQAFNNALDKKKLTTDDFYAKEIGLAHKAMTDYLKGKTDHIAIDPTTLSGLDKTLCLGKPKATVKKAAKPGSGAKVNRKKTKKAHKQKQLNGVEPEPTPAPQSESVVVNRFVVDMTPTPAPSTPVQGITEEDEPKNNQAKSDLFTPITAQVEDSGQEKIELPGDLGKFLGYVERYEYSILLRGEKGAGKSRMTYQMMNTFAKAGFSVGCFSLEIGKQSNIVKDMRNSYISPTIANQVFIADSAPNGLDDIKAAAAQFDVVCVDSWGKIPGIKSDDFDKLRKEFPKTMFIIIFQSTTNGTARGGSAPEYDAGIVIQVAEGGRAYCEKNRYSGEDFTYLVFERRLASENKVI